MSIITLLLIITFLVLFSFGSAGLSMIIWLPTKTKDLERIKSLAHLKAGEIFYDLGCGDGKVVMYLGHNTEAQVIGLELAWPLFLFCRLKQQLATPKNINFKLQNLFKTDLTNADVIYVFGIPEKLKDKLRPKLEQELKPGSRVISYAFKIGGWEPSLIDQPSPDKVPVYVYNR